MKVQHGIAASIALTFTIASINVAGLDGNSKRVLLDKRGGTIEVRVSNTEDKAGRDSVRRQLREEANNRVPLATATLQQHRKEIKYRYENTALWRPDSHCCEESRSACGSSGVPAFSDEQCTETEGCRI